MARNFVLDSSAVLALLNDETGADVVAEIIPASVVSAVNLAEVISSLVNKGVSGADAESALLTLDCKSEPFRRDEALLAGRRRCPPDPIARQTGTVSLALAAAADLA